MKHYLYLSFLSLAILLATFACNIGPVNLHITPNDVLWFIIIVVGGAVLMAILMIFFVAGNKK